MKTYLAMMALVCCTGGAVAGPTTIWIDIPSVNVGSNAPAEESQEDTWGDVTPVVVKGISFGMTKNEVARKLGGTRVPYESTELPCLFVAYPSDANVRSKLTIYFGTFGACLDRVVGIETTFYKTALPERDTIVNTLEKKFGFKENYNTTCPSADDQPLGEQEALPQHVMKINEMISLVFRTQWDDRRDRTYIVTVLYKHALFDESLRQRGDARERREQRDRDRAIEDLL
jgi:hypothetical protein